MVLWSLMHNDIGVGVFFPLFWKKKDNKLSVQCLFIRILGRIIVLVVGCYSLSFQFQSALRIKDINFCLKDWQIRCVGCTFKLYPVMSLLIWFQHWLWRKWNLVYREVSDNKWQGHSWKRAGKKRNSLSRPAQGCDIHVARRKIQPQSSSLDTTAHLHVLQKESSAPLWRCWFDFLHLLARHSVGLIGRAVRIKANQSEPGFFEQYFYEATNLYYFLHFSLESSTKSNWKKTHCLDFNEAMEYNPVRFYPVRFYS